MKNEGDPLSSHKILRMKELETMRNYGQKKMRMFLTIYTIALSICTGCNDELVGKQNSVKVESLESSTHHNNQKVKNEDIPFKEILEIDHAKMLEENNKLILSPIDMDAIHAEDEKITKEGYQQMRVGIVRSLEGLSLGRWSFAVQKKIDGIEVNVLQQAIISPGATGIRVHFKDFTLPESAALYVYGLKDEGKESRRYTKEGPFGDGDFWSVTTPGDTVILEYHLPTNKPIALDEMPCVINEVVHNYIDITSKDADFTLKVGTYHNDICGGTYPNDICDYDSWRTTSYGVAGINTEGGSSGSPLFTTEGNSHYVVGQLRGGVASCNNPSGSDNYGEFSSTYPEISSYLAGGSDDSFEENDSSSQAKTISANSTYNNLIVKIVDEDWYQVYVGNQQALTIDATFTDAYGDIELKL